MIKSGEDERGKGGKGPGKVRREGRSEDVRKSEKRKETSVCVCGSGKGRGSCLSGHSKAVVYSFNVRFV